MQAHHHQLLEDLSTYLASTHFSGKSLPALSHDLVLCAMSASDLCDQRGGTCEPSDLCTVFSEAGHAAHELEYHMHSAAYAHVHPDSISVLMESLRLIVTLTRDALARSLTSEPLAAKLFLDYDLFLLRLYLHKAIARLYDFAVHFVYSDLLQRPA